MSGVISRRSILKAAAYGAALAVTPVSITRAASRPKRVVVVGAGLSGLAAALELVDRGHDVTIVEAQMRPGGRVLTVREPFADGLHADMGAARIPTIHDWTLTYVKRFGLSLSPFWPDAYDEVNLFGDRRFVLAPGASLDLAALPLSLSDRERSMGLDALSEALYAPLQKLAANPRDPRWPPKALHPFDEFTTLQYVRKNGWSQDVAALLQFGYGEADADYGILEDIREFAHDPDFATRMRIVGGNDLLPKAMAASLSARIQYGRVVEHVEQNASRVRVHCSSLGGPEVYEAERVVVTAPLPPLRRVAFTPALSAGKQRAIRELRYDPLSRVALQVRGRPWATQGRPMFAKTDLPSEVWDATWDRPGDRGIISVYVKSRASLRLSEMSESERIAFAVAHAEKSLPGISRVVESGVSKSWTEDRWSGGIAWLGPRQYTELMPHVSTVEGRVHFAGEHTSAWHGWMQGALESGHRAAIEVDSAA